MRNHTRTALVAVFQAEVLLNSKRVAPYALTVLFAANAVLWWGWGPAVSLGWATNSDYYIVRNFLGFSFLLGLPIFNAVIMGDPVIRDFRLGVDPLIFSKPVSRAEYLLGKFLGNFFVLACCQSAFALTLLVLQAFRTPQMIVQPVRVWPYFKHFLFFVVVPHLAMAAFYFTVGTLTRNTKIVYGLSVCFYPLYISYQALLLKGLSPRGRTLLDPFLFNAGPGGGGFGYSADFLNNFVVNYSADMIANRALMILAAAACLAILYLRFTIAERAGKRDGFSTLNLSTAAEGAYLDPGSLPETSGDGDAATAPQGVATTSQGQAELRAVPLPAVDRANEGVRANVDKLIAALGVEFRLLRAERSLVVLMPLAVFLSTLELAFYEVVPDASYSATYASGTARSLLLFLSGMTVFYTGEAMSRDREVGFEPVLWSTPAPNHVLLLSKFLATLSLTLSLTALVGLTALAIQFLRGHTPVEIPAYLLTYSVVLLPGVFFLAAVSVALNVVLRDKHLAYAASIGTAAALFYLYSQGYHHWLYNPLLYQLWSYADLTGAGGNRTAILLHRLYCLAVAGACLSLAHLCFERKSTKVPEGGARLSSRGKSILWLMLSVGVAVTAGLVIGAKL